MRLLLLWPLCVILRDAITVVDRWIYGVSRQGWKKKCRTRSKEAKVDALVRQIVAFRLRRRSRGRIWTVPVRYKLDCISSIRPVMSSIYSSGRRSDSEEYEGSGASDSDSDYEQDDGDDNGDDRPSRAGPARPTRSEYAAYAAMVRDLTAAKEGNLARQLLQAGHHTSHDEFHDSEPAQAAINQSSSNGIITTQSLTTAWPLRISELPKLSVTLNEVILAFASSYIRKEGLVHSASAIGQSVNQDVTSGSPSKRGQALSDQLESTLPDLVISTRSLLEENLARLGTMRPAEVRKKRAKLGRMGWRDVMAAAGLDSRRRA